MTQVLGEVTTGTKIGGYRVLRTAPVEQVGGKFIELEHERLGTRHLHVACEDDNNAFAIAFQTIPSDSTGVAHILEHVVLAGSQKFPVRDPFFAMINRSLSTFMNAFTGSDQTVYPFSTRNRKDFFNLLSVYLDATFFPRLEEGSFQQEGHRLEFKELEDITSGLRHKGVVFNEMKGARSAPPSILARAIGQALFPDLTYAFDSGGEPKHIVDLTWEQLKQFHATYYHPSVATFVSAGDIPLEDILAVIEREVLDRFQPSSREREIGTQSAFAAPVRKEVPFPITEQALATPQAQALVSWATVDSADTYEILKMTILREVLIGNAGSPLRRALVESGIGEALADMSGFFDNTRQATFNVGLKGIDPANAEKVEDLVVATLERLATEGLEPELVDAALHQVEIEQREVSNARFPYSLQLVLRQVGVHLYGGDAFRALRFDEDIARFVEERAKGRVLEDTIRKLLLDNRHRALIVLVPDTRLEAEREEAELAALARLESGLSDADKAAIVEVTRRLRDAQEAGDEEAAKNSLPDLDLSDIPSTVRDPDTEVHDLGGTPLHVFPQHTNGFVYFDVFADFSHLPAELKDDLGLFTYALTRSGAAGQDYAAMARRIELYTGGIGAQAAGVQFADGSAYLQAFQLQGKALTRNAAPYAAILRDLVGSVTFERGRLKDVIAEYRAMLENFIAFAGTQYAVGLASASLSPRSALNQRLGGLTFIRRMRHLSSLEEGGLDEVISNLERIRAELFSRGRARISITAEDSAFAELQPLAGEVAGVLGTSAGANGHVAEQALARAHRARTWAVPVAYNAIVRATVPYTHADAAPLAVLAQLLREQFIHPEIREKGGAYGGQVSANPDAGIFSIASYRDPNITRSYEVFGRAVDFATNERFEKGALKGAILGASRSIDPLDSPDTRGRRRFMNDMTGFTLAERQQFKARLLATTEEDLRRVAQTYLANSEGVMATIADPEKAAAANAEMANVFEVEPL